MGKGHKITIKRTYEMKQNKIPKKHENKEICSECGGECCKKLPCTVFPGDLNFINEEILTEMVKGKYCFDYWEGNPTNDNKYDDVTAYFIRPKCKHETNKIVDASWGGECVFLTPKGCQLHKSIRPSEGKALIPTPKRPCIGIGGWDKREASILWLPHNELITKIIKKFS